MKAINSKAVVVFQDVCQAGKGAVLAGSINYSAAGEEHRFIWNHIRHIRFVKRNFLKPENNNDSYYSANQAHLRCL